MPLYQLLNPPLMPRAPPEPLRILQHPLSPATARQLVRDILKGGHVNYSGHVIQRMEERSCDQMDVVNVLRCGNYEAPEIVSNSWRYRIRTNRFVVVIAFRDKGTITVVTAWRERHGLH